MALGRRTESMAISRTLFSSSAAAPVPVPAPAAAPSPSLQGASGVARHRHNKKGQPSYSACSFLPATTC